jgi:hypothetical protein
MGRSPEISQKVAKLLKEQKGKCGHCGNYFQIDSVMEIHHRDENHKNNKPENLRLLHRHCHDNKHFTKKGMYDKHRVVEELYEWESLMYGFENAIISSPSSKGILCVFSKDKIVFLLFLKLIIVLSS